MNQETKIPINELFPESMKNRIPALLDLWYIFIAVNLIYLALMPFMGIVIGIILMAGGGTALTKKWGKVSLIIGIITTALFILFLIIMVIFGIFAASNFR
jgi:hypothetical protein